MASENHFSDYNSSMARIKVALPIRLCYSFVIVRETLKGIKILE